MDRIFFENIRCFATRQEARLAPLTILVGENSSGKSTFLALVRMAWDLAHWRSIDFNEEPFLLGAYDQVLSTSQRSEEGFCLGLHVGRHSTDLKVAGEFGPKAGLPGLTRWHWDSPPFRFSCEPVEERFADWRITVFSPDGPREVKALLGTQDLDVLPSAWALKLAPKLQRNEEAKRLRGRIREWRKALGVRPLAFAPVRTKPQRTYDPIRRVESPEGAHVPLVLASMPLRQPSDANALFAALSSFGHKSGLFERVEARRLGPSESDPFQIQVLLGGRAVNLIDVGYGVSQVLPIVVDCLRGEKGGTFLLQQPEVHLHPSAQAELGSFFGFLAKKQKKRFIIETHSDYLVDRIRMDIRDGKGLKPEDVSLLYFERTNGKAQIHALELDDQGNILDPPPGYRRFFLEEERRLLGI